MKSFLLDDAQKRYKNFVIGNPETSNVSVNDANFEEKDLPSRAVSQDVKFSGTCRFSKMAAAFNTPQFVVQYWNPNTALKSKRAQGYFHTPESYELREGPIKAPPGYNMGHIAGRCRFIRISRTNISNCSVNASRER